MPFSTLNDLPVLSGLVALPRAGAWHADLVVDAPDASQLQGAVTLVVGKLELHGVARRSGAFVQRASIRVVGGAGGLATELEPKGYRSPSVSVILGDIVGDAGEALSPTVDGSLLASVMPAWVRVRGSAGTALSTLADALHVGWRVLLDGTVWLGAEAWPAADVGQYDVLDERPEQARAELGTDSPALLPGTTLEGRRVSYVEHVFDASSIRTRYWWES